MPYPRPHPLAPSQRGRGIHISEGAAPPLKQPLLLWERDFSEICLLSPPPCRDARQALSQGEMNGRSFRSSLYIKDHLHLILVFIDREHVVGGGFDVDLHVMTHRVGLFTVADCFQAAAIEFLNVTSLK